MGNKTNGACTSNKNKGASPTSKQQSNTKSQKKQSGKKIKFGKKATIPQSKLDRVKITKSLNLEKCKYTSIPANLFMIDNLEIVNLNDNNIKQIDDDIIPSFDENNNYPEKKQIDDTNQNKIKKIKITIRNKIIKNKY